MKASARRTNPKLFLIAVVLAATQLLSWELYAQLQPGQQRGFTSVPSSFPSRGIQSVQPYFYQNGIHQPNGAYLPINSYSPYYQQGVNYQNYGANAGLYSSMPLFGLVGGLYSGATGSSNNPFVQLGRGVLGMVFGQGSFLTSTFGWLFGSVAGAFFGGGAYPSMLTGGYNSYSYTPAVAGFTGPSTRFGKQKKNVGKLAEVNRKSTEECLKTGAGIGAISELAKELERTIY